MFGYLNIARDKLPEDKRGVWQSFMCGMCFSTKKLFGNLPRLFISNDVNFFSVLFHAVGDIDVNVEQRRCFSSPFKKRPVIEQTELMDKMAVANVLLTRWNLYDDIVDGGSLKKKTAFRSLGKAYRRAKVMMPELDDMLRTRYEELRSMEQANNGSLDEVCHSFARLSQEFALQIMGDKATDDVQVLCYNLGKWIYLVDALDDADKDVKRGNYNPFIACYGVDKASDLVAKFDELQFLLFAVLNRVAMAYNDMNTGKYGCILQNVLFDSIRDKSREVLARYDPTKQATAR